MLQGWITREARGTEESCFNHNARQLRAKRSRPAIIFRLQCVIPSFTTRREDAERFLYKEAEVYCLLEALRAVTKTWTSQGRLTRGKYDRHAECRRNAFFLPPLRA